MKGRKNPKLQYIVLLQGLILSLFSLPHASYAGHMENLRNKRYCEIIVGDKLLSLAVFNTIGLNDCPENVWSKITEKDVKTQTSAYFVRLNGPRYWVIDGFDHTSLVDPKVVTIGGLEMRKAAIVSVKIWDALHGDTTYREHHVKRKTIWIYKAGSPVYELISPKGEVYVMQSYSVQKTPLTIESLTNLGSKLTLPKDWTFKTGVLKEDKEIPTINNEAIVLQDNFLNTYQKASKDLL